MNIYLALSYAGICSICMGGCASAAPKAPKPFSDVPLVEMSRNAMSVSNGELKIKNLINQGTDVNQRGKGARTALMEAAFANYVPVVKLLIQKGAKVNLRDNGGSTALILAAAGGNTESARILLKHGADVNAKGSDSTPLIAAVNNHKISKGFPGAGRPYEPLDTIKLLLANGANVHAKGANGKTALMIAEERKIKQTIAVLKKAGAQY